MSCPPEQNWAFALQVITKRFKQAYCNFSFLKKSRYLI